MRNDLYRYRAYGLVIHSELELPELDRVEDSNHVGPTVRVSTGPVAPLSIEKGGISNLGEASPTQIAFYYHSIGRFCVRSGFEIVVDPFPGTEQRAIRNILLGPCMGALLHQRSLLVLHASAVAVAGGAVAFIGKKGWGKSTTAAALHARGFPLIADDILAVSTTSEGAPFVYPGFPHLRLWPDAVAALGISPESLPKLHRDFEKRSHRLQEGYAHEMLPLHAIYVLCGGDRLEIEPVSAQDKFVEVVRHTYLADGLKYTETNTRHFHQSANIARNVPVFRLRRRTDLNDLWELTDCVDHHVHTQLSLLPASVA